MSRYMPKHSREEALFFHRCLPRRLWRAFREAGLPDDLIRRRLLGWDGRRITVPVFNRERQLGRFAHLSDPLESGGLGPVEEERFAPAELYGWEIIQSRPERLFITADPWERLLLEGRGFRSIGLVGEPMTFKESWRAEFQGIREVYVAFPRSGKSLRAAKRILEFIPQARLFYLPPEVGEGGIAEFFLVLKRAEKDFLRLLPPRDSAEDNDERKAA